MCHTREATESVTIYGSLASDGRQFFRTYDKFNAVTFVDLPQRVASLHFGKAVLPLCDRAPQHRSRLVREFHSQEQERQDHVGFPKGSPYLNAVEECWRQGKRRLLVSEYYRTFSDMCRAISTYYRTARYPSGINQLCKQKNRVAPHELMIFAIAVRGD